MKIVTIFTREDLKDLLIYFASHPAEEEVEAVIDQDRWRMEFSDEEQGPIGEVGMAGDPGVAGYSSNELACPNMSNCDCEDGVCAYRQGKGASHFDSVFCQCDSCKEKAEAIAFLRQNGL